MPDRMTDQGRADAVEHVLAGDELCPACQEWQKAGRVSYGACNDCWRLERKRQMDMRIAAGGQR